MRRRTEVSLELAADQEPYLEELAEELEVDPAKLEKELATHPIAVWRVRREEVRLRALLEARRRELTEARARVAGQLRRSAGERGRVASDAEVEAQVALHVDVARAQVAFDEAGVRLRKAKALAVAFDQRLTVLGHLIASRQRSMSRS